MDNIASDLWKFTPLSSHIEEELLDEIHTLSDEIVLGAKIK